MLHLKGFGTWFHKLWIVMQCSYSDYRICVSILQCNYAVQMGLKSTCYSADEFPLCSLKGFGTRFPKVWISI